ncbi:helix-turn-helix domain-containing protein [Rubritalea sp.]|uniref:helix-turn-helix domain-containing protein n=1 Tax=Rubritalea sp. TaxID=2109375 RepID=UPI003EF8ACC6
MQRANVITKCTQGQADFALRVKVALLKSDMNISELAAELGLSRNTVSLAINRGLYLPTQKKIKAFLNIK